MNNFHRSNVNVFLRNRDTAYLSLRKNGDSSTKVVFPGNRDTVSLFDSRWPSDFGRSEDVSKLEDDITNFRMNANAKPNVATAAMLGGRGPLRSFLDRRRVSLLDVPAKKSLFLEPLEEKLNQNPDAPEALLFFVPGSQIDIRMYEKFAREVQENSPLALSVAVPNFWKGLVFERSVAWNLHQAVKVWRKMRNLDKRNNMPIVNNTMHDSNADNMNTNQAKTLSSPSSGEKFIRLTEFDPVEVAELGQFMTREEIAAVLTTKADQRKKAERLQLARKLWGEFDENDQSSWLEFNEGYSIIVTEILILVLG